MEQSQSAFLVVGQTGIVLQDIIATIESTCSGWRGVAAHTMDAALDLLDDVEVRLAFVVAAPQEFVASRLAARLNQSGARVVLMGDAAEEFGTDAAFPVLHRPFASDDIVAIACPPDRKTA